MIPEGNHSVCVKSIPPSFSFSDLHLGRGNASWRTIIIIATMAMVWFVFMFYRMEIRAHWWAYRLRHAQTAAEKNYYTAGLAAIGDTSLSIIPSLLADESSEIRLRAIDILRYCPAAQGRLALLRALEDPDERVSLSAALTLARRIDGINALDSIEKMLRSDRESTACAAVVAIERIGGIKAESMLLQYLDVIQEPDLVAQIADSLGILGSQKALPQLKFLLGDHRPVTIPPASWRRAAEALSHLRNDMATRGLIADTLPDGLAEPTDVAAVAQRALHLITDTPLP